MNVVSVAFLYLRVYLAKKLVQKMPAHNVDEIDGWLE